MKLHDLNKIIFPVVYTLFIVETTYLVILHRRERAFKNCPAQNIANKNSENNCESQQRAANRQKTNAAKQGVAGAGRGGDATRSILELEPTNMTVESDATVVKDQRDVKTEKVLDQIDELLADDREFEALELARTLMNNPDPEIRSEAVGVFAWAGVKGLADLSIMLADPNEDVAQEAADAWENAIDEISDDAAKAQVLAAGIKTMTNEENAESAIMLYDTMDGYIAVPALVSIIQNGTPVASKVAREHYEFFTDESYTSPEAAAQWVARDVAENSEDE